MDPRACGSRADLLATIGSFAELCNSFHRGVTDVEAGSMHGDEPSGGNSGSIASEVATRLRWRVSVVVVRAEMEGRHGTRTVASTVTGCGLRCLCRYYRYLTRSLWVQGPSFLIERP